MECLLSLVFLLAADPAAAADERVALKDGTVYLGQATALTDRDATIEVAFSEPGRKTVPRDALTGASLLRALSARGAAGDGKARLELGQWAEERGLLAAAISEYCEGAESASPTGRVGTTSLPDLARNEGRVAGAGDRLAGRRVAREL